jgi:hypothetical protein
VRSKKVKFICLLVMLFLGMNAYAVQWGPDAETGGPIGNLLNDAGGFEFDGGSGPWILWADGGELSTIHDIATDSRYVKSGSYSWKAGPATAGGKLFRASYLGIPTVANRRHSVVTHARYQTSSPGSTKVAINGVWYAFGSASSIFGGKYNYFTLPANENTIDLVLQVYSNSANDTVYMDDIKLYREVVSPLVGGDNLNNVLVKNKVNNVIFNTYPMFEGYTNEIKIAFDPDIVLSSAGAAISNVQWLGDTRVSADIVPSSAGTLTLTFRNVYSDKDYNYTMTVVNPPLSCGQAGTVYSTSDLNFDCEVNFEDFAVLASQWLKCTDAEIQDCGF